MQKEVQGLPGLGRGQGGNVIFFSFWLGFV